MYEHQSRQVDCGSADDGLPDEETPDLGLLQEAAEAAELAEATAGLTDGSGGPLPAEGPLRPLACGVARALTEAGFAPHRWDRPRLTIRLVSAPAHAPSVRVLRTLRKLAANAGSCSVAVVWRTSRSMDQ